MSSCFISTDFHDTFHKFGKGYLFFCRWLAKQHQELQSIFSRRYLIWILVTRIFFSVKYYMTLIFKMQHLLALFALFYVFWFFLWSELGKLVLRM